MRGVDTQHLAEPRDVPNPHAAAVGEVDDFRRATEAQHVGGQHAITVSQRFDVSFPPEFRADTELAAVQQHDRIALSRFQIAGPQPVDQDGLVLHPRHAVSQAVLAKVSSCVASSSSWSCTVVSVNSPAGSQIWSAELIATPNGVGHARNAWPILRSWPSVPNRRLPAVRAADAGCCRGTPSDPREGLRCNPAHS